MHQAVLRTPPYGLASLVTFALLAVPSCLLVCGAGLALFAIGVVATVVLPFGIDPPDEGLVSGLLVILASIVGTLVALLAIVACAAFLSAAVLPSLAFLVRLALGGLKVRSAVLTALCFAVAGLALGLCAAAALHGVGVLTDALVVRSPLLVFALYAIAAAVGEIVSLVYGGILIGFDAARATARRTATSFQRGNAGSTP